MANTPAPSVVGFAPGLKHEHESRHDHEHEGRHEHEHESRQTTVGRRKTAKSTLHRKTTKKSHLPKRKAHHHHHEHEHEHAEEGKKKKRPPLHYVQAFRPVQYLLTLVGQFPCHANFKKSDETYTYHAPFYSPGFVMFFVMLAVQFILILAMLYNTITIFTQEQYFDPRSRSEELRNQTSLFDVVLLSRYRHVFISIWVNLLCAFGAQVRMSYRVQYFQAYLGYWSRVMKYQDMQVGEGMWKFSAMVLGFYFFFIGILAGLYIIDFSASFRGVPSLMAIMMFKFCTPDILNFDDRTEYEIYIRSPQKWYLGIYQHIGAGVFILILVWSKSIILIFLYKCKLLSKAFAIFNERVYMTLIKKKAKHPTRGELSLVVLFTDHCCLLDLLEGTDKLFSNIFEPFIGLHMAGLMHELYYLFMNVGQQTSAESLKSFDNNYFPRPLDFVFSFMIVFQNLFFLIYVSRVAIELGESAMGGLEVVRQKAMMRREGDEELFFQFSMFNSFSGRSDGTLLRCGGYFTINKQLITGVFATFLGYYIILQQFSPTFEYSPTRLAERSAVLEYREKVGKFLFRLEHLAYCHWVRAADEECPLIGTTNNTNATLN